MLEMIESVVAPAARRRERLAEQQTNGAVEALHRLILEECWRPAFARYLHVRLTALKRDLEQYIDDYNSQTRRSQAMSRAAGFGFRTVAGRVNRAERR